MSKTLFILATLVSIIYLITLAQPLLANDTTYSCPALAQDQAYKNSKFKSYKYVISGHDGWLFRSKQLRNDHLKYDEAATKALLDVQKAFAARGTELVIAYPPTRSMVAYDHIPEEVRLQYQLPNADTMQSDYLSYIKDMQKDELQIVGLTHMPKGTDFAYKRDHHWNTQGAKAMAKEIASFIKDHPKYASLTQTKYSTNVSKDKTDFAGTLGKAYADICAQEIPTEEIFTQQTTPIEDTQSENALFGDVPQAEVILVGTSNSANKNSESNFEGALKQALSVDIENHALAGARVDGPMISYLNSGAFDENTPKFLIWEIPGYYKLKAYSHYLSEVKSAAYGSCGDRAVYRQNKIQLTGNKQNLANQLKKHKIKRGTHYVRLAFDQDIHHDVTLNMTSNGQNKEIKYRRNARITHSDVFYTGLVQRGFLETISIHKNQNLKGRNLNIEICPYPKI